MPDAIGDQVVNTIVTNVTAREALQKVWADCDMTTDPWGQVLLLGKPSVVGRAKRLGAQLKAIDRFHDRTLNREIAYDCPNEHINAVVALINQHRGGAALTARDAVQITSQLQLGDAEGRLANFCVGNVPVKTLLWVTLVLSEADVAIGGKSITITKANRSISEATGLEVNLSGGKGPAEQNKESAR
jgi:hypothetical protein